METTDASVLVWVLPVLLVVTWAVLWVVRRRVPWWFFAAGAGVAVLCFLGGVVVAATAPSGQEVTGEGLGSGASVLLLINGVAGFAVTVVLAVVSALVAGVRRLVRGSSSG